MRHKYGQPKAGEGEAMSVDFDFSLLGPSIQSNMVSFLNQTFARTSRPSFLGPVVITSLELPLDDLDFKPKVKIIDIVDVWKEFSEYPEDEDEGEKLHLQVPSTKRQKPTSKRKQPDPSTSTSTPSNPSLPSPKPIPISLQLHLSFHFHGPISLSLKTSILLNHPAQNFISLPVTLSIRAISVVSEIIIAFEGEKRRVNVSLLALKDEDGEAETDEGIPSREGYSYGGDDGPGEQILREIVVDSEIGSGGGELSKEHSGSVLRNVGKIEKFVLEVSRKALEAEVCYPNFQTLEF